MKIPELDLTNTPGIYYAIAYGLSAILYISLNRRKKDAIKRKVTFFILWCILFVFMGLTYKIRIELFLPCVAVELLLIFLMIRMSCEMERNNQVYFTVMAFIQGEFAASLEWQLFYFALTSLGVPLRMWTNLLMLVLVHGVIYFALWQLQRPYAAGNLALHISTREMWIAVFLGVIVYALSNISYVLENTPFSGHLAGEIFAIHTLADLGGVAILFGYHMTLQEVQVRREVANLQNVLELQYKHYRLSEETIDLVNRKYHDLKHQIAYLKSDITEKQKQDYLDAMESEIKQYEAQNQTGNHVVDTILTEKSLQCQRLGIRMNSVVDGTAMDFLPVMEICSLMGNALDNAMEAAQKVEDPGQRLICFSVDKKKGFLRFRVENRFEGELKLRDGLPVTTKSDTSVHGFGLRSMQSIADSHEGSLHTEIKDGWYRLQILIPIPE